MSTPVATPETLVLRELLAAHRLELDALLARYDATNPRLFGSVARGEAGPNSDIDILVDLNPRENDSDLFRIAGLTENLRRILGHNVDVFAQQLLKEKVSVSAVRDAVPL